MGMGFQFEQHRLGLWDLKKTISWEMGLGPPPPPSRPSFEGEANNMQLDQEDTRRSN